MPIKKLPVAFIDASGLVGSCLLHKILQNTAASIVISSRIRLGEKISHSI